MMIDDLIIKWLSTNSPFRGVACPLTSGGEVLDLRTRNKE
jgi:hypothetical protein